MRLIIPNPSNDIITVADTKDDLQENDLYGTDGIRIGKAMNEDGDLDWVSYKSDRHLLTVAPTRIRFAPTRCAGMTILN